MISEPIGLPTGRRFDYPQIETLPRVAQGREQPSRPAGDADQVSLSETARERYAALLDSDGELLSESGSL